MSMFVFSLISFLYRISNGRIGGKMGKADVLLLTTIGRKSGKKRTLPLVYIRDGAAYVITASAAGASKHPGWFFNVRSNPQSFIQAREKRMVVTAEVAGPEKKAELWLRLVEVAPGFAEYQKRTTREIPMVLLHPVNESA